MKNHLQISLSSVNDGVRFHAIAPRRAPLTVDYFPPPEDTTGYTSLELLLISAASCLATAVKLMATNRLGRTIDGMSVNASAVRRNGLPTDFERMEINLRCASRDLKQAELTELVRAAQASVCPVFAMLKDGLETTVTATVDTTSEFGEPKNAGEPAQQQEV